VARRTKQEAQETRNRILDTAELVFHERGVSRTSLAEIADAAGLTRGAIYWHFRNKADLFDAMMSRVTLPLEEMAQRAGDAALTDPLAFVRECALNVLLRTAADPQCRRVFEIMCHKCEYVDEMTLLKARHIECRTACLTEMERGFVNAIARGQLASGSDPRRAALGLSALIDGLINDWLLDPAFHSLAEDAGPIVDMFLAGLGARPAAPAPAPAQAATVAKKKAAPKQRKPVVTRT
jgi:TetR/AcrR family transcriptional regulator, acrAB operon repressor